MNMENLLIIGEYVYTKPIKDFKKVEHGKWEVKAIYPDCNDGNGVGYLLVSGSMQWRANNSSIGKTIFKNKEDLLRSNVFVA